MANIKKYGHVNQIHTWTITSVVTCEGRGI